MDRSGRSRWTVFRNSDKWTQQAYLKASPAGPGDYFGISVALSATGDTLVVGAPNEDSTSTDPLNNTLEDPGAAYVFSRSETQWSQAAFLKAASIDAGDHFGYGVAINAMGNTIAVGGDWAGDMDSGQVYVYQLDGKTGWEPGAVLQAAQTDWGDGFGWSVAFSGDGETMAVGAQREDSATGANPADDSVEDSGAVYLFRLEGGSWAQKSYIKAKNPGMFDYFGYQVALSYDGTILVVAAYNEDSATTAVNGEPNDDAPNAGAAYIFTYSDDTWSQQAFLKATNAEDGDLFGSSVAIDDAGKIVAVGAIGEDSAAIGIDGDPSNNGAPEAGAIYLFTRNGAIWSQKSYIKGAQTRTLARLGDGVVMSPDGSTLVGGAGSAMGGADPMNSAMGAAYLY